MASDKSPKKRKRTAFKEDQATQSTTTIRVEVTENNPSHDPVLVSFPRGVPTSILDRDKAGTNNASNLPRFAWSKLKASSDRGRCITGSDDTCTYSATASGRGHDGRLTKLYVVALDKKSKTMKLIPTAEKGTIFALDQSVKAYTPNVSSESTVVGGNAKASASDRVQMLVESFGSKKKQKVMASRASNVVNINKVVGAGNSMMDSVVGQGGISEGNREMLQDGSKVINTVDAALLQARRLYLPPFDEKATAPNKVYNPQLMAGEAWAQVSRIVDKVIKHPQEDVDKHWIEQLLGRGKANMYVPQSIKDLLQTMDPFTKKGHIFRVKSAFFLALMLRFHHKISQKKRIMGDTHECVKETRAPPEVGTRLLELFTSPIEGREEKGVTISKLQLDKLHAYILILYVIASGSDMKATSINQLCKDMKMDEKNASAIYREAGFAVKKSGVDIGVSLSVPLTFPPPKRGKK